MHMLPFSACPPLQAGRGSAAADVCAAALANDYASALRALYYCTCPHANLLITPTLVKEWQCNVCKVLVASGVMPTAAEVATATLCDGTMLPPRPDVFADGCLLPAEGCWPADCLIPEVRRGNLLDTTERLIAYGRKSLFRPRLNRTWY